MNGKMIRGTSSRGGVQKRGRMAVLATDPRTIEVLDRFWSSEDTEIDRNWLAATFSRRGVDDLIAKRDARIAGN